MIVMALIKNSEMAANFDKILKEKIGKWGVIKCNSENPKKSRTQMAIAAIQDRIARNESTQCYFVNYISGIVYVAKVLDFNVDAKISKRLFGSVDFENIIHVSKMRKWGAIGDIDAVILSNGISLEKQKSSFLHFKDIDIGNPYKAEGKVAGGELKADNKRQGAKIKDTRDEVAEEGGLAHKMVESRIRNHSIAKKRKVIDKYVCKICKLDPVASIGLSIADVHHVTPLHLIENGDVRTTSIDDLITVCPTCHRLIHLLKCFDMPSLNRAKKAARKLVTV